MITASVSLFDDQDKLAGVAGIDILLKEVLKNITYFSTRMNSYAFIIDDTGRAIGHPMLPWPQPESPSVMLVKISAIERQLASKNIIKRMIE